MLSRLDVERTRHRTTNIGPMPVGLRESNQATVYEHRSYDSHIAEMGAATVGVVYEKNIPWIDVALKAFDDRLGGAMQCSHMNGNVSAPLHNGIAICIAQTVREVAAVDDE